MSESLHCPGCFQHVHYDRLVPEGKSGKCPHCGYLFLLPQKMNLGEIKQLPKSNFVMWFWIVFGVVLLLGMIVVCGCGGLLLVG